MDGIAVGSVDPESRLTAFVQLLVRSVLSHSIGHLLIFPFHIVNVIFVAVCHIVADVVLKQKQH